MVSPLFKHVLQSSQHAFKIRNGKARNKAEQITICIRPGSWLFSLIWCARVPTPGIHTNCCIHRAHLWPDGRVAGLAFLAQFAVCRVGMGFWYWHHMISAVAAQPGAVELWGVAGIVLFGLLMALNTWWLVRCSMPGKPLDVMLGTTCDRRLCPACCVT